MGKQFINGGSIDKVTIVNSVETGCIKLQVIGDTKAKRAEADLEIEVIHTDGYRETLLYKCSLKRGKNKCFGLLEINVPYTVADIKVTQGTVRKV